jgi:hypothetical protein
MPTRRDINDAIFKLDREQIVKLLEEGCGIQCYDHETLPLLRTALAESVGNAPGYVPFTTIEELTWEKRR